MRLFLIRHGHKLDGDHYNKVLRIHDHPLSEKGCLQAERLVELFEDIPVTEVYASRYSRTQETAEPLAASKNLEVRIDPRLDEIDGGFVTSLSDDEVRIRYPEFWEKFSRLDSDFTFPGGESGEDVMERISSFLDEHKDEDGTIAAFSHEGLMRTAMCRVFGLPSWKRFNMKLGYCGIIELEYDPGHAWWKLLRYNYTADRPY